jgi:hypothetical protein
LKERRYLMDKVKYVKPEAKDLGSAAPILGGRGCRLGDWVSDPLSCLNGNADLEAGCYNGNENFKCDCMNGNDHVWDCPVPPS